MVKIVAVVLVVFLGVACASPPDRHMPSEASSSEEVDVSSEKDRLPHDAGPRPAQPTCPPGMVGSCR